MRKNETLKRMSVTLFAYLGFGAVLYGTTHWAAAANELIGQDGAPMALVPAGEFSMGNDSGEDNENPVHPVDVNAFYMDKYELTVSRYARFLEATGRKQPDRWNEIRLAREGNRPVTGVDWNDANAYCRWAGKRLPTEAEWEKAARGTDARLYPWGNEPPTSRRTNYDKTCILCNPYEDMLKPTGSYEEGKSPYGLYDMLGNVQEWTADWYEETYYARSPRRNPTGPAGGKEKVVRGGSWLSRKELLRSSLRDWEVPSSRFLYVGFRCVKDALKQE